jgi:hypothetical protein
MLDYRRHLFSEVEAGGEDLAAVVGQALPQPTTVPGVRTCACARDSVAAAEIPATNASQSAQKNERSRLTNGFRVAQVRCAREAAGMNNMISPGDEHRSWMPFQRASGSRALRQFVSRTH